MSWAKHDDTWDDCPEYNDVSADAVALMFRVNSRMARLGTDGVLTARDLDVLDQSRPLRERDDAPWSQLVAELMSRGLLVAERDHWLVAGWLERNPSRDEVSATREYDAIRQRIRYAKANGADAARLAELKADEDAARRALFTARDRRQSAALSQRRTVLSLTTEKSLHREVRAQSHNAPTRPVPSRPKDEDEDEGGDGGNAAGLEAAAAASEGSRVIAPVPNIAALSRREMGRLVREAQSPGLHRIQLGAFHKAWGHLYPEHRHRTLHPVMASMVRSAETAA